MSECLFAPHLHALSNNHNNTESESEAEERAERERAAWSGSASGEESVLVECSCSSQPCIEICTYIYIYRQSLRSFGSPGPKESKNKKRCGPLQLLEGVACARGEGRKEGRKEGRVLLLLLLLLNILILLFLLLLLSASSPSLLRSCRARCARSRTLPPFCHTDRFSLLAVASALHSPI